MKYRTTIIIESDHDPRKDEWEGLEMSLMNSLVYGGLAKVESINVEEFEETKRPTEEEILGNKEFLTSWFSNLVDKYCRDRALKSGKLPYDQVNPTEFCYYVEHTSIHNDTLQTLSLDGVKKLMEKAFAFIENLAKITTASRKQIKKYVTHETDIMTGTRFILPETTLSPADSWGTVVSWYPDERKIIGKLDDGTDHTELTGDWPIVCCISAHDKQNADPQNAKITPRRTSAESAYYENEAWWTVLCRLVDDKPTYFAQIALMQAADGQKDGCGVWDTTGEHICYVSAKTEAGAILKAKKRHNWKD